MKIVVILSLFFLSSCVSNKVVTPYYAQGYSAVNRASAAVIKVLPKGSQFGLMGSDLLSIDGKFIGKKGYYFNAFVVQPGERKLAFQTTVSGGKIANYSRLHGLTFNFKKGHTYKIQPDPYQPKTFLYRNAPTMMIFDETLGRKVYPLGN